MKVKELKTILGMFCDNCLKLWPTFFTDQRNVKCVGCSEKADFVKKCQETEHLEM